jgi:hypothetical protein
MGYSSTGPERPIEGGTDWRGREATAEKKKETSATFINKNVRGDSSA